MISGLVLFLLVCAHRRSKLTPVQSTYDLFCRWQCVFFTPLGLRRNLLSFPKMRSARKQWCSEIHHAPSSTKPGSHHSVYLFAILTELRRERDVCEVNLLLVIFNYLPSESIFNLMKCFYFTSVRFSKIYRQSSVKAILLLDWELLRISLNWCVNQASCWACESMCLLSFPDKSIEQRNGLWMAKRKRKKKDM